MKSHHVSFKHAFDGLIYCFLTQPNYRFHLAAMVVVSALGYLLKISSGNWIFLVFTFVLVLTAEMLNTAIESLTDLVTDLYKKEAKVAKDVSAAMVLTASFGAVIVGLFVFLPYLSNLFSI